MPVPQFRNLFRALEVLFAVVLPEELAPDVEVSPVDEVEDAEEDGRADEEEPVDVGVLVVPRRVLLLGHGRLPTLALEAVHSEVMPATLETRDRCPVLGSKVSFELTNIG